MKASPRSNYQKHEPSMQGQSQCGSQTSPSAANESTPGSSRDLALSVAVPNPPVSGASVLIETDSDELRQKQSPITGLQATQSNHLGTIPSITSGTGRSSEDVYNWRKYGEKHIKGNDSRSYYRCSQQNCQAKKQVVKSKDGQIKDIIYKGEHEHPKPHSSNQTEVRTPLSVKEGSEKTPNGHSQASHNTKTVAAPDLSPIMTSPTEDAGARSNSIVDENKSLDGPESAHDNSGRLDHQESELSDRAQGQCESTALAHSPLAKHENAPASSCEMTPSMAVPYEQGKSSGHWQGQHESPSAKNGNAGASPHKLSVSVRVPNPLLCAITSRAIGPVEFEVDELQPLQVLDPVTPSDHKGAFIAAERLSEDGYNWRKYGQKRIIGSEFPRSYYRCTHPNCQVKKQLERSHDGKITEIVYKGKHDHPKPQPSSRMVVGTVLSIQEDSERVPQLNSTKDKISDGYGALTTYTKPNGICEGSHATNGDCVEGEGSQSNEVGNEADDDDNPESKRRCLNKVSNNASVGSNHQKSEPSMQIQVYMVASKADLPAGVKSDERLQQEGSDSGIQATQSYHKGTGSLIPTERLPEDVYNWRKYGQKTIKGNEFPRSYYRCTYPNCQVKKQLGLSHDGRIIEIIYKGKHDHPKPLPRGAIVAIQEDRPDMLSSLNSAEGKVYSEHGQTSRVIKIVGAHEVSVGMASDDDVEVVGSLSNRMSDEIGIEGGEGEDDDPQSKRRKKDIDALDVAALGKTTREPRRVVETLSEVDVLDDGYRWHKYGRKLVKGNPNPRNYYRCSSTGCSVKKHVERASHNPKLVITTYEGKHDHDMPAPKTISLDTSGLVIDSTAPDGTIIARLDENETVSLEAGGVAGSIIESRVIENPEALVAGSIIESRVIENPEAQVAGSIIESRVIENPEALVAGSIIESRVIENSEALDAEPVQDQPNIASPDSSKMVEATVHACYGGIDGVGSRVARVAEVETLSLDTPP